MKQLTTLIAAVAMFFLTADSIAQPTPIKSEITDVTIYLEGAVVTRTATVNLKQGANQITLTGITNLANENTIQVKAPEGVLLQSVHYGIDYARMNRVSPEVQAKKDSLADARFSLKTKQALKATYNQELALLEANRSIGGDDTVLLVEDIEDMANFYRDRVKEIYYKTLELEEEEKELNELISRLSNELANMNQLGKRNVAEVDLKLNASTAGKKQIQVSYFVWQAGWIPSYDIRSKDTGSPVVLNYGAKVRQSTGSDWTDVRLTLSSGNPVMGGTPPELQPWRLYLQEQYRKQGYGVNYRMAEPAAMEMDAAYEDVAMGGVEIERKVLATTFEVEADFSIPSDNVFYEVGLDQFQMTAEYRHFSVPKMQQSTFLTAAVTGWEQYSLLPGEASIYFQGDYVGTSFIDPFITTDTLQLSLGQDPGVVITHEKINDFCKTSTFGGKKSTSRAYKIVAMNTRPEKVSLRIEDQVPLSSDSDITIEVEEMSGAKYDFETGKLTWDIDLQPGESKEVVLRFTVKYPKKKPISNL